MSPSEEAAAILNHYLSELARRSGLRWTERNRADIERAAQLLSSEAEEEADTIPPYQPRQAQQLETRVTQVLERSPAEDDPRYTAWRNERRRDDDQTRRMLSRERGRDV